MDLLIEFVKSLSLTAYVLIGFCVAILFNLKKLLTLRSPLDTWQHRFWKNMGGADKPEHIERNLENKDDY